MQHSSQHRELHYRSFGPESWGQTSTVAPVQQEFQSSHSKNLEKAKSFTVAPVQQEFLSSHTKNLEKAKSFTN